MEEKTDTNNGPDPEQALIACFLMDNSLLDHVLGMGYSEAILARSVNRKVMAAMINLRNSMCPIEPMALSSRLDDDGDLELVGGYAAIAEIMTACETTYNYQSYLRLVLTAYRSRLFTESVASLDMIDREKVPFDEKKQSIERVVNKVSDICLGEEGRDQKDIFAEAKSMLERLAAGEGRIRSNAIYSGVFSIDEAIGPLDVASGHYNVLLMGPTSWGKSSLAAQYVNWCCANGKRVAVFLGETSKADFPLQLTAQRTMVQTNAVKFMEEPVSRQREAIREIDVIADQARGRLHVFDTNFFIESVISRCRSIHSNHGNIDLVVIDHIHILRTSAKVFGIRERIDHISSMLKPIAKELGCVVLSLAQPKRGEKGLTMSPPDLSDLKESGSLENDADLVLAIHPLPVDSNGNTQTREFPMRPECDVHALKNRKGALSIAPVYFNKPYTKFENREIS